MTRSTSFDPDALVSALKAAAPNPGAEQELQRAIQSRLAVSMLGATPVPNVDHVVSTTAPSVAPKAAISLSKAQLAGWAGSIFSLGVLAGLGASHLPSWSGAAQVAVNPSRIGTTDVPSPVPSLASAVGVAPEQLALVESMPTKPVALSSASPLEAGSSLAQERRILDEARQALARGQPAEGTAPLERHVARFPKGILTEEREALYVRVLAALGNHAAALARAEAFQRRFPNSIFYPAVRSAVGTISERTNNDASKP
jgi:hypothetical protein